MSEIVIDNRARDTIFRVRESHVSFFDGMFIVLPNSSLDPKFPNYKIGPDYFPYVMLECDLDGIIIDVAQYVNTDPSGASRWQDHPMRPNTLDSGVYRVVKATHNLMGRTPSPGYFIMSYSIHKKPTRFTSELRAYNSAYRKGLRDVSGTRDADYMNIHAATEIDDGSLGCFTMPTSLFDRFHKKHKKLSQFIMFYDRKGSSFKITGGNFDEGGRVVIM